jgi:hypothetical protein
MGKKKCRFFDKDQKFCRAAEQQCSCKGDQNQCSFPSALITEEIKEEN